MNETKPQTKPRPSQPQQQQQAATDIPDVKRDPVTGINKDMPGNTRDANGDPKDPKWGNHFCR